MFANRNTIMNIYNYILESKKKGKKLFEVIAPNIKIKARSSIVINKGIGL